MSHSNVWSPHSRKRNSHTYEPLIHIRVTHTSEPHISKRQSLKYEPLTHVWATDTLKTLTHLSHSHTWATHTLEPLTQIWANHSHMSKSQTCKPLIHVWTTHTRRNQSFTNMYHLLLWATKKQMRKLHTYEQLIQTRQNYTYEPHLNKKATHMSHSLMFKPLKHIWVTHPTIWNSLTYEPITHMTWPFFPQPPLPHLSKLLSSTSARRRRQGGGRYEGRKAEERGEGGEEGDRGGAGQSDWSGGEGGGPSSQVIG